MLLSLPRAILLPLKLMAAPKCVAADEEDSCAGRKKSAKLPCISVARAQRFCFLCLQLQMSVPAATAQKSDGNNNNSEMQSAAVAPSSFLPSQSGKIPGRKRGRPPLRNVAKMDFPNRYPESLPPLKVPKKRGRKPGFKVSL